MTRNLRPFIGVTSILVLMPGSLTAQEIEPRTYANAPVGVNILGAGYAWTNGAVLLDPALPIEDLDADLHAVFLRYVRTFGLFGSGAKLKLAVPYIDADWSGKLEGIQRKRSAQGIGDAVATLEWNFVGAPALSAKEFRSFQPKTIVGASIRVALPTGDYDSDRLLNLGSNRWTFRGEIGMSRRIGSWDLELSGEAWVFFDNDEFFGGMRLEQDPLYSIKTAVIYNFNRPGMWFGIGAGLGEGGTSTVDGVRKRTRQRNWRFGAVFAYPINRQHGVSLVLGSGVVEKGGSDFDVVGLGYQYAWGF